MKWNDTIASECRYGDIAARIFGEADIIWEHSESDYQGFASVLAHMPDGTFVHYEWSYGSCTGCDEWEASGLDADDIEKEMRSSMAVLRDAKLASRYLRLDPAVVDGMSYPTANSPTNGSIPGMMRVLGGGVGTDFTAMGKAFEGWLASRDRP